MATAPPPTCAIAIRSYGAHSTVDRHEFAQVVLPLSGRLEMDIGGRGAVLDRSRAAFVEAGARHDQTSTVHNRSLILDLHAGGVDARSFERLARQPYLALGPEAGALVDYMGLAVAGGRLAPHRLRLWVPLLVDALLGDGPATGRRLAGLVAAVEADLSLPWTVEAMARQVGLSASRLHAVFQRELGQAPHAWLAGLRLERARHLLVHTGLALAEVAARCGYADQSAMTRAVRRATGVPPGALRRAAGEQA